METNEVSYIPFNQQNLCDLLELCHEACVRFVPQFVAPFGCITDMIVVVGENPSTLVLSDISGNCSFVS